MKKFFVSMFMAILAISCVTTLTSCGGDDDIPGDENSDITIGTHRIDVEFEGNTTPWTVSVGFSAVKASSTGMGASLYEDGKELTNGKGVWTGYEFRSYSVSTDDKCQSLCCLVHISPNAHSTKLEPFTVRLKGYVNGKLKKEQTFVIEDNNKTKLITFFSEISINDNVTEYNM